MQTGGVGSKYDDYWAGQLPQIRAQVQRAAAGASAMVSVPDLTRLGARRSWYGVAEVRAEIRGSGLWNVHHVTGHYEPRFLQRLAQLVDHQE